MQSATQQLPADWLDDPQWHTRLDEFTGWEDSMSGPGKGPAVKAMAETVCQVGFAKLPPHRRPLRWTAADRLTERAVDVLGELRAVKITETAAGLRRVAVLAGPPLTKWATDQAIEAARKLKEGK
jgi:hypothetical protein